MIDWSDFENIFKAQDANKMPHADMVECSECGWSGSVSESLKIKDGDWETGYYDVDICPNCEDGGYIEYTFSEERGKEFDKWYIRTNGTECYRIVEVKNGEYHSLFHGTNGSRQLPKNQFIHCEKRYGRDGSGNRYYTTGFHVFKTKEEAEENFTKNFRRKEGRQIIKVIAFYLRPKEHSRNNVWLAEEIYIPEDENETDIQH